MVKPLIQNARNKINRSIVLVISRKVAGSFPDEIIGFFN
jgi:hypothetical protein